jgi:hypothetical protein
MTTKKFEYFGMKYFQSNEDKPLLTFVASAFDVLSWGGVPSKNERFHGGFQRALSPRHKKIAAYFDDKQVSPGSIVVAFRPGTLQISDLSTPNSWPSSATNGKFVHIWFESEDLDSLSTKELIEKVNQNLGSRLKSDILTDEQSNDENKSENQTDEFEEEFEESNELESQFISDDDDIDIGQSKLKEFFQWLNSEEKVLEWINKTQAKIDEIKKKTKKTQKEIELIEYSAEQRLKETLKSLLKPAMIVDGQHRVNGAFNSENDDICFTISAVKDADWVEQVFQFVVLNKTARAITKDFLTEMLNTSLTNSEIKDVDKRLEIIGIHNIDRVIHKYLNHDIRSPFFDQIAAAGEVAGVDRLNKLSQQGMIKLAKRWKQIGNKNSNEIKMFLPILGETTITAARAKWVDSYEIWITAFYDFWQAVKEIYDPHQIWVKQDKFHLLYIVTMHAMQDQFLSTKSDALTRFESRDDFKNKVKEYFSSVPAAFFQNWTQTGLQSGEGPDYIKEAIKSFVQGKSLKKVMEDSPLYAKKSN